MRAPLASYGLAAGIAKSLDVKLEDALGAVEAGDTGGACAALADFLNQVRAQAGKKKLTAAQAEQLSDAANDIRAQLGC
ncbi:MAG: FIMAH domain-containing protein [Candidatus Binatia bacterium]